MQRNQERIETSSYSYALAVWYRQERERDKWRREEGEISRITREEAVYFDILLGEALRNRECEVPVLNQLIRDAIRFD